MTISLSWKLYDMTPSWIVKYLVWLFEATRMICHRRKPLRIIISSYEFWKIGVKLDIFPGKGMKTGITSGPSVGQTGFLMNALCDVFHSQKRIVVDWLNHPFSIFSFLFLTGGHVHQIFLPVHDHISTFSLVMSFRRKSYLAGRTIRVILQRAYVPPKAANVKL